MRHKNEAVEFTPRSIGKDEPPVAREPMRAAENEEWAWMVDEDPAFYLSRPEAAGA